MGALCVGVGLGGLSAGTEEGSQEVFLYDVYYSAETRFTCHMWFGHLRRAGARPCVPHLRHLGAQSCMVCCCCLDAQPCTAHLRRAGAQPCMAQPLHSLAWHSLAWHSLAWHSLAWHGLCSWPSLCTALHGTALHGMASAAGPAWLPANKLRPGMPLSCVSQLCHHIMRSCARRWLRLKQLRQRSLRASPPPALRRLQNLGRRCDVDSRSSGRLHTGCSCRCGEAAHAGAVKGYAHRSSERLRKGCSRGGGECLMLLFLSQGVHLK